ncbi:hypothetical protein ZWY2020_019284 [Hordeum vulgare]|nr:hypothetical protein ZWY2020_019284 [Hordeum vulgare]
MGERHTWWEGGFTLKGKANTNSHSKDPYFPPVSPSHPTPPPLRRRPPTLAVAAPVSRIPHTISDAVPDRVLPLPPATTTEPPRQQIDAAGPVHPVSPPASSSPASSSPPPRSVL